MGLRVETRRVLCTLAGDRLGDRVELAVILIWCTPYTVWWYLLKYTTLYRG